MKQLLSRKQYHNYLKIFFRKDFNESIKITNDKRDAENTQFWDKIATLQKSTYTLTRDLTKFIKGTLTVQDSVITSLKRGQESMDNRMTTVTNTVQQQMDEMHLSLVNLQKTLLHVVGVPDPGLILQQCAMTMTQTDNIIYGSQPILPGGSIN